MSIQNNIFNRAENVLDPIMFKHFVITIDDLCVQTWVILLQTAH